MANINGSGSGGGSLRLPKYKNVITGEITKACGNNGHGCYKLLSFLPLSMESTALVTTNSIPV